MLNAALRDLQWRERRFLIAVVGTAFVFAMTLVLTGLANGFRVEAGNTVNSFGVYYFVIQEAYLLLPVVAVGIGLLASVAGLRRAVAVDPAIAFGGP